MYCFQTAKIKQKGNWPQTSIPYPDFIYLFPIFGLHNIEHVPRNKEHKTYCMGTVNSTLVFRKLFLNLSQVQEIKIAQHLTIRKLWFEMVNLCGK